MKSRQFKRAMILLWITVFILLISPDLPSFVWALIMAVVLGLIHVSRGFSPEERWRLRDRRGFDSVRLLEDPTARAALTQRRN